MTKNLDRTCDIVGLYESADLIMSVTIGSNLYNRKF
jgi:hypothetical protein